MEEIKTTKKLPLKLIIILSLVIIAIAAILLVIFLTPGTKYFSVTRAEFTDVMGKTSIIDYYYDDTGRVSKATLDGNDYFIYTYSSDYKTVNVENKKAGTKRTLVFNDKFDITQKLYSDGSVETYQYDKKGKITTIKIDDTVAQFKYKGKHLIAEEYSNGDYVQYEHSGKKILSKTISNDNLLISRSFYYYDKKGRLESEDRMYEQVSYLYDSKSRLINKSSTLGAEMSFSYDEYDNITYIGYSDMTEMKYSYEETDITKEAYKQNKELITYNDTIENETVYLLN